MKKYFIKNNGSITLELLIAFAILIINITAVMLILNGGQMISIDTQTNNEALMKAQNLIEKAKSDANLDFNLVNPTTNTDTLPPYYSNILNVETSATDSTLDLWTKRVTSTISWQQAGRTLTTILTTLLTNKEAINGGDTCSSVVPNPEGWKTPLYYLFPSVTFSGPNANGIAISDLDVFNQKLYIGASSSPNTTPHSFFIFDLPDDPSQPPVFSGSLDNNSNSLVGLSAVRTDGNYAYVANAYTGSAPTCTQAANCAQLQIIDVQNPVASGWNPTIKNLKIGAVTAAGKLAAGTTLFYKNGYVYLGLAKTSSGYEFNIIDVGGGGLPASPTNPIWKSGYSIGNGVNSIYVKNNYAYVASPNTENLVIIDISDKANPFKVGGYSPAAAPETNGVGSNHGHNVFVIGHTTYLGRTYGTNEFYTLDTSNPANISTLGLPQDIGLGNKTSINGLLIRSNLAFFCYASSISDLEYFESK